MSEDEVTEEREAEQTKRLPDQGADRQSEVSHTTSRESEDNVPRETVRKREWLRLALRSLLLAGFFGVLSTSIKLLAPDQTLLLLENSILTGVFATYTTYCTIRANLPKLD